MSQRTESRNPMVAILSLLALLALVGLAWWWPSGDPEIDRESRGY